MAAQNISRDLGSSATCADCDKLISHSRIGPGPACTTCAMPLGSIAYTTTGICHNCSLGWLLTRNSTATRLLQDTARANKHGHTAEMATAAKMLAKGGQIEGMTITPVGGAGIERRALLNNKLTLKGNPNPNMLDDTEAVAALLRNPTAQHIMETTDQNNAPAKDDNVIELDTFAEIYNHFRDDTAPLLTAAPLQILAMAQERHWQDTRRHFKPACRRHWIPHKADAPSIKASTLLLPFKLQQKWHSIIRTEHTAG